MATTIADIPTALRISRRLNTPPKDEVSSVNDSPPLTHPELLRFRADREANIAALGADPSLQTLTQQWSYAVTPYKYSYNFDWLGRPIIQVPQDVVAFQEIVWHTKPDLIIETGIAHGGSLVLSASLLAMLDYCDAATDGTTLDPKSPRRKVVGIDIDIRRHNRELIEAHPMAGRIEMLQGSSIAGDIVARVKQIAGKHDRILVCLDSNHSHDHVLAELQAYAPLVSKGSYCIVWDTIVEDLPKEFYLSRDWGPGNNPKTAVFEYLENHPEFQIDKSIQNKLLITVAPDGYLRRV